MSKLMTVLKDHVCRLARKEIRTALRGMKSDRAHARKALAELREQARRQEQMIRDLARLAGRPALPAAPDGALNAKAPITVKSIRALRRKLKVSQAEFGKLVGVNAQSIWKWEHGKGRLRLRHTSRRAVAELRAMGVREARKRLETLPD